MALRPDNTLISNREMLIELAQAPFRLLADVAVAAAEKNARTQALRAISDMSEAELKTAGITRVEAMQMITRHEV